MKFTCSSKKNICQFPPVERSTNTEDFLAVLHGCSHNRLREDFEGHAEAGGDSFLTVFHMLSSITTVARSLQEGDGLLNILVLGHDAGQHGEGSCAVVTGPFSLAHIEAHFATGFLLGEEIAKSGGGNAWPVLGSVGLALSWVWLSGASGGNEDGNLLGHALLSQQMLVEGIYG